MIKTFSLLSMIFLSIACENNVPPKEAVLLADMQSPMGWNYLRIYKDLTFQFESKKLLKSTFYEGSVYIEGNVLYFNYKDTVPSFGDMATIDGVFITFDNGLSNEILEISLDTTKELTKQSP